MGENQRRRWNKRAKSAVKMIWFDIIATISVRVDGRSRWILRKAVLVNCTDLMQPWMSGYSPFSFFTDGYNLCRCFLASVGEGGSVCPSVRLRWIQTRAILNEYSHLRGSVRSSVDSSLSTQDDFVNKDIDWEKSKNSIFGFIPDTQFAKTHLQSDLL